MEMDDADWHDQIENNLNGTANTVRAFGPKMVARKKGRCRDAWAPRTAPPTQPRSGAFSG